MLLYELATLLRFSQDNPGGDWLRGKREDNEHHKRTAFGAPQRFGPVTGYFNRPVLLPVKLVSAVKGQRGEQGHVRDSSLSYLLDLMDKTKKLPVESGNQYAPFIMIDQAGEAWVSEGNHRIMAAAQLGWRYIPVEVRYFTGGEDVATAFSPAELKAYDAQALAAGYEAGNSFIAFPQH